MRLTPSRLRTLTSNRRGAAVVETALLLPTILFVGLGGIELTSLALATMRTSQIAAQLADNGARVSAEAGLPLPVIREADVNELLASALAKGASQGLGANGRVILSSLEYDGATDQQIIRWQRCAGKKSTPSAYGKEGKTGSAFLGMGPPGEMVSAPRGMAVMFVEVRQVYQPTVMGDWLGERILSSHSAFLVRDDRDLTVGIINPEPAAPVANC